MNKERYLLANVIPPLITTEINPAAPKGTLQGGLIDLVERMRAAVPQEVEISKEDWLVARKSLGAADAGGGEKPQPARETASPAAVIPREVPSLPRGHVPRKAIIAGIKRELVNLSTELGVRESAVLLVQGMGGSGKTVVATGIARDPEIGQQFDTICFVGVGQDADLRELQRSLHYQLTYLRIETFSSQT